MFASHDVLHMQPGSKHFPVCGERERATRPQFLLFAIDRAPSLRARRSKITDIQVITASIGVILDCTDSAARMPTQRR
jgi:hypothetical protein